MNAEKFLRSMSATFGKNINKSNVRHLTSLTALRVVSALLGLISVGIIVRTFSAEESGTFFVILAGAQFIAGATLGPLLILAIRFGSIHYNDGDSEALGRLIIFGASATALVGIAALNLPPLILALTAIQLGNAWTFAAITTLTGAISFLGGIVRASGHSIPAIVPENLIRPAGLASAALFLWITDGTTAQKLSIAYLLVLISACIVLMAYIPWRKIIIPTFRISDYHIYLKEITPLLSYGVVSTALSTCDIFLVTSLVSVEAVPAYKIATQFAIILTTGTMFANLIYGPKISIAHHNDDFDETQKLARLSSKLSLCFYILIFSPLIFGYWIFPILFGEIGSQAWHLALILSVGRLVNAWFGSVTVMANLTGHTFYLAMTQALSFILIVIAGQALASEFGSEGIAAASALALSTWVLATTLLLRRRLGLKLGPL